MKKVISVLTNWKTSLPGILQSVAGVLVVLGVIDIDTAEAGQEAVVSGLEYLIGFLGSIGGVAAIFSRDHDVSSEDSGAK